MCVGVRKPHKNHTQTHLKCTKCILQLDQHVVDNNELPSNNHRPLLACSINNKHRVCVCTISETTSFQFSIQKLCIVYA